MVRQLLMLLILIFPAASMLRADGMFLPQVPRPTLHERQQHHRRYIEEPEQKAAIVYQNGVEHLILNVRYKGAPDHFAWLVPTPSRPKVYHAPSALFHTLDHIFLEQEVQRRSKTKSVAAAMPGGVSPVTVVERKQVGIYDATILKATSSKPLLDWLHKNHYDVSDKALSVLNEYVKKGWYFTATRIDLTKTRTNRSQKEITAEMRNGSLPGVRLSFKTSKPVYPLRISSVNPGTTRVLLYLISQNPTTCPSMNFRGCQEVNASYTNEWLSDYGTLKMPTKDLIVLHPSKRRDGIVYITRLEKSFTPTQMKSDLTLSPLHSGITRWLIDRF